MAELLTDEIIIEKLNEDGIMQEPDGPWLLEYIQEQHGGKLDNTSDFVDDKWTLKIYSESTADCYDIYWCTEWSDQAVQELASGADVWVDPNLWSDMEYDFNYELEQWWQNVYDELYDEKKDELLDSEDYYWEDED